MTRAQLEAAFWQIARDHHATIPDAVAYMDALLAAADRYAYGDETRELLAERLAEQHRADLIAALTAPLPAGPAGVWHWQKPDADEPRAVCHGRVTSAPVTRDRERVTCGTCKQSRTWRAA